MIKSLAAYVKTFPDISNLDEVASAVFGSQIDDLQSNAFKESVQYYLNGTKEGLPRYKSNSKYLFILIHAYILCPGFHPFRAIISLSDACLMLYKEHRRKVSNLRSAWSSFRVFKVGKSPNPCLNSLPPFSPS